MRKLMLLCSAALVGLLSCTSYEPPKFEEVPPPPMVEKSEPIAFRKILVKIPFDTVVGYVHDGLNKRAIKWDVNTFEGNARYTEMASNMLKNQGYSVIEESDDLFGTSSSSKARFQLAGTVTSMMYNYAATDYVVTTGLQTDMVVDVEWQLFDSFQESVVFKEKLTGEYYTDKFLKFQDLFAKAYEMALRKLLNNKTFVEYVTTGNVATTEYKDKLKVGYKMGAGSVSGSSEISKLFPSVVTIRSGLTHGSGFFISSSGYIITANHVVSGVEKVQVVLQSGEQLEGKVLRQAPEVDAALVKVEAPKTAAFLPVAEEMPSVGNDVFVIGTPLEKSLSYTVSKGIVSGYRERNKVKQIQTDAAINQGNSGGPLVSSKGAVIGFVSSKLVGTTVEGVGFGIPMEEVIAKLNLQP